MKKRHEKVGEWICARVFLSMWWGSIWKGRGCNYCSKRFNVDLKELTHARCKVRVDSMTMVSLDTALCTVTFLLVARLILHDKK